MCFRVILLFFILGYSSAAFAEFSLENLAKQCEGTEPKPEQPTLGTLMCASYIAGALDQIILTDALATLQNSQTKRTICGPDHGKIEQLSSLVIFAAKQHPELRKESARAVLRGLISGEFTCS